MRELLKRTGPAKTETGYKAFRKCVSLRRNPTCHISIFQFFSKLHEAHYLQVIPTEAA